VSDGRALQVLKRAKDILCCEINLTRCTYAAAASKARALKAAQRSAGVDSETLFDCFGPSSRPGAGSDAGAGGGAAGAGAGGGGAAGAGCAGVDAGAGVGGDAGADAEVDAITHRVRRAGLASCTTSDGSDGDADVSDFECVGDDGYAGGDESVGAATLNLLETSRLDHATGFVGLSRSYRLDAPQRPFGFYSKSQQEAHKRKVLFGSDHILP
jgi:hypothetical protein